MITATGLTKRYRRVAAVDGVTFTCEPGTITGFLGRNGAGKPNIGNRHFFTHQQARRMAMGVETRARPRPGRAAAELAQQSGCRRAVSG
jgi:ABC-2 type transport system ATP-binding protein